MRIVLAVDEAIRLVAQSLVQQPIVCRGGGPGNHLRPLHVLQVAPIALSPSILIVAATSPYQSPQDIIAAAKAAPGKLVFGSGGNGNSGHLSAALFKSVARIDVQHVPSPSSSRWRPRPTP